MLSGHISVFLGCFDNFFCMLQHIFCIQLTQNKTSDFILIVKTCLICKAGIDQKSRGLFFFHIHAFHRKLSLLSLVVTLPRLFFLTAHFQSELQLSQPAFLDSLNNGMWSAFGQSPSPLGAERSWGHSSSHLSSWLKNGFHLWWRAIADRPPAFCSERPDGMRQWRCSRPSPLPFLLHLQNDYETVKNISFLIEKILNNLHF